VRKAQTNVTERHRSILTEWLCEVSGLRPIATFAQRS
jgi:hypothetical protein